MRHFLWILICSAPALAQYEQAAFTGTIRDPQHLPVPNAHVRITDAATVLIRSTLSNSEGLFFAAGLSLGSYSVSVAAYGFATVVLKDIRLSVGATRTVDVTLQLAPNESEPVPVTARLSE